MEEITIHEFDFALINEFFTELERQGPGSPEETIRALGFIGQFFKQNKNCRFRLRHRLSNNGSGTKYKSNHHRPRSFSPTRLKT